MNTSKVFNIRITTSLILLILASNLSLASTTNQGAVVMNALPGNMQPNVKNQTESHTSQGQLQYQNVTNNASAPVQLPRQINMNNLSNADSTADELNQLKRKLEVEKAQAELKKLRNPAPTGGGNVQTSSSENAQTTVTGVAIDQNGKKIAWLQFTDGGSLTVNIGSKVGKYTVSDISMTGVQLSYSSGKKNKPQIITLKRAYYAPEKPKNQMSNQRGNSFFSPSPIVTNANTSGANDMVPPIITAR